MLRLNSMLMLAAAAIWMSGTCQAQNCNSCSSDFSYPGSVSQCGGCGDCGGCQSGGSGNRPKLDSMKALNHKVCARNDAWPKPFNCADRQLYFTMWNPMIDHGFEEQCVLSSVHFDPETHELNKFGISTVQGIMQNMPTSRKKVFINRDSDQSISQARLNNVDNVIHTYYKQVAPNAEVAFSNLMPSSIRGPRAETINKLFLQGAPAPIIPISSGSQSVSSSIE